MSRRSLPFILAAAVAGSAGALTPLVAPAQTANTTIQEGRININRTYQAGDSVANTTYQTGVININRTIQFDGRSGPRTGLFERIGSYRPPLDRDFHGVGGARDYVTRDDATPRRGPRDPEDRRRGPRERGRPW